MIALLAAAAVTLAAPSATDPFELPMGRVRIEANKLEVIKAREVVASGGIFLTAPGIRIRAEEVRYERTTGRIDVSGGLSVRILVEGEEATLTAASATFDTRTTAGILRDATIKGNGLLLSGKRIVRSASGAYRIDEAQFSPCGCPGDATPSWEITANRIRARPNGLAVLQGGVLRAKGVPVFFLPIGFAPFSSERASGFLSPQVSTGGNDGVVATMPLYLALSKSWDMTVAPGWAERRGPFVGSDLRFANSRGRGDLEVVYRSDERIKEQAAVFPGNAEDYPRDRWYTNARVMQEITSSTELKTRLELAGDDRYNFDFGPSLMERSRPEYESNVFVERRGEVIAAVAGSTYYQDLRVIGSAGPYNPAQTVSPAGTFAVSAPALPLLGRSGLGVFTDLGLGYEIFNNVSSPQGSFRRGGELSGTPRRQVQHLRARPSITIPFSAFGNGLRVDANGAVRGDASADPLGADTRTRIAPEVGAGGRLEFRRTFGESTKVQHRVGPVTRWSYIPLVEGDEALTSFESPLDTPVEGHRVEVGISNRVLYRRKGERGARPVRELLEIILLERFRTDGPEEGESAINIDVRTGPLRMDIDAAFDNATGEPTTAGGRAATKADAPEGISVEYAYAPDRQSHQITGGGWLKLAELSGSGMGALARALRTFTIESGARYDFDRSEFLAVSGGVAYESPCGCWGLHLGAVNETDRKRVANELPVTGFRVSIDLHPPKQWSRFQSGPGGR